MPKIDPRVHLLAKLSEKLHGTNRINPADRKRPILDKKPIPWLSANGPFEGEWAFIDENRVVIATAEKLCIVCGTDLGPDFVYANFDDEIHDEPDRRMEYSYTRYGRIGLSVGSPTPTFVHPRCCLLAASFCPHLQGLEHPALDQAGMPLTRDALRKLANVHTD